MFRKWQKGFTMVEMLVVMFVIIVLAVLTMADYRRGEKQYRLSQAAQRLISDLRRAQNMAMSGVEVSTSYCGYGIYLEKGDDFYIIYGDDFPTNCQSSDNKYDGGDGIIETVNLPQGVKIKEVSSTNDKIDVFFKPPKPTAYLNIPGGPSSGTITLEIKDTSLTKKIEIATTGLIQLKDDD